MSTPLEPPELDNFTWVRRLGGGGFADVHLYTQRSPSRSVAIKVLRSPATDQRAMRVFEDEANLMARISDHPHIVPIYEVGLAADHRPYIVMEYYSKDHLGLRVQAGGMDLTSVLEIGVQIGSAIETAHRADIVHRDIKPANILVSRLGDPALTDFGIASVQSLAAADEEVGLSFFYASPEVMMGSSRGDVSTDVYSFAATLYALLAGRAPFQIPGGDNTEVALMRRVESAAAPPPIGKPGLPQSVERLLAHAMQGDSRNRPRTVAEFAASLQAIESELGHRPTPFRVEEETEDDAGRDAEPVDEGTRAKVIQVVRQPGPPVRPAPITGAPRPAAASESRRERARVLADAPVEGDTVIPAAPAQVETLEPESTPRLPPWVVGSAAAALVVVVGLILVLAKGGGEDQPTETTAPNPVDDDLVILGSAPVPTDVSVRMTEGDTVAVIEWDPGDREDGDLYVVQRVDIATPTSTRVDQPTARVPNIRPQATPCFAVHTVRAGQASEQSSQACAPG